MNLDTTLKNIQHSVPECVAASAVDIDTGMLLAMRTDDSRPRQEVVDMLASATGELFQGQDVVGVEDMFKRIRGVEDDDVRYIKEIVLFSQSLLHLFQRCRRNPNVILTTVCRKQANLGKVMVKSRTMLEAVDQAV